MLVVEDINVGGMQILLVSSSLSESDKERVMFTIIEYIFFTICRKCSKILFYIIIMDESVVLQKLNRMPYDMIYTI